MMQPETVSATFAGLKTKKHHQSRSAGASSQKLEKARKSDLENCKVITFVVIC